MGWFIQELFFFPIMEVQKRGKASARHNIQSWYATKEGFLSQDPTRQFVALRVETQSPSPSPSHMVHGFSSVLLVPVGGSGSISSYDLVVKLISIESVHVMVFAA